MATIWMDCGIGATDCGAVFYSYFPGGENLYDTTILEERFDRRVKAVMAFSGCIPYSSTFLYLGALTIENVMGVPML